MDRFREFEVFAEIATAGSLAGAGRRLNMSPPAVTRVLASLEDRLGVRLAQRTTRNLTLTEAGRQFLDAALRVLSDVETAEREAAGAAAVAQGRIAVTAPASFGRLAVVPVLAGFLKEHPRVQGSAHLWDRNVNLIEEGIDVAVRIGALSDTGLIARRVGQVRRMLVASPDYLKQAGVPRDPDDIASHRIIAFRGLMPTDRLMIGEAARSVTPWMETNDVFSALTLALDGFGIMPALSYMTAEHIRQGTLVEILPGSDMPERDVHLVWPEARLPRPAVRAFIDFAVPRLSAHLAANAVTRDAG